jgi:NADH-quinone oxidoreductase subunit N
VSAELIQSAKESIALVGPEMILAAAGCAAFLVDPFLKFDRPEGRRDFWGRVFLLAMLAATLVGFRSKPATAVPGALVAFDGFATSLRLTSLLSGIVLVLIKWREIPKGMSAELFGSLAFLIAGLNLTAASNDLLALFVALELVSIPTYVLLGLFKSDNQGLEATLKYFLLSVFSSAMLLMGVTLIYGSVGATNLGLIAERFRAASADGIPPSVLFGFLLALAGLGFRMTAVPFHFYAPDVFAGTSTSMAAMLALVPKIAGFAAGFRLFALVLPPDWQLAAGTVPGQSVVLLWSAAIVTMLIGNTLALQQTSIRRLLAYSSVAHAGYMLVGLASVRADGPLSSGGPIAFYLAAYAAMTLGLFATISILEAGGDRVDRIEDLSGLVQRRPAVAILAAIFLLSLLGFPPTAGFLGKFQIFFAAWSDGSATFRALAIVMAVNAAIGAWYYLRLLDLMFLRAPKRELTPSDDVSGMLGAVLCAIPTVLLFLAPNVWSFR